MNVRDTSIEAYHKIKESGVLSERRMEVYDILFNHGPLTATEIFQYSKLNGVKGYRHNTNSRLYELRDMGVVKEVQTTTCSVTGQTVILWDVTSNLPEKLEKKKSNKEIIQELTLQITELRNENYHLKSLLEQKGLSTPNGQILLF